MLDLVVIGSGPGGYVAAIRAAQLGMNVACIEKDASLGGTCLNVGCIPSKALLDSSHRFSEAKHGLAAHGIKVSGVELDLKTMMSRKDRVVKGLTEGVAYLFKKNKIERVTGTGRIAGPGKVQVQGTDGSSRVVEAQRILIATGSVPSTLRGVDFDGQRIVDSTGALAFTEVPARLGVIGAGVIGVELGSVWNRLGSKVTVLEYLDRILAGVDGELATAAQKVFTSQGLQFQLGRRVQAARVVDGEVVVEHADASGTVDTLRCDRLLVATGRKPYTSGLGCTEAGIKLDPSGRIEVDGHFQTSVKGIYAIGDVIAGPMLAHKAEEEGIAAVEQMATGAGHVNQDAIPNVVYTFPELASVGKSEEELKAAKIPYRRGSFPFRPNGRARAMGVSDGMVKVLAHEQTDRLLGVHILGPSAGDLIAEAALAIDFQGSAEDVARTPHAHPTLSEVTREAALAVAGRALHA